MAEAKLNVYNLGALGINLVDGPIHMKDGELLQCQNAMAMPIGAQIALVKRPGMDFLATTGAYNRTLKSFLQKAYQERSPVTGSGWSGPARDPTANRVVAVTGSGTNRVITTDDGGATWTPNAGQAANLAWNSVAWAPSLSLFAAVASGASGGTGKVMTSPDGLTWTQRNFATANADWSGIAWSESLGLFIAVSESGVVPTPLETSPDGITWTARTGVQSGWRNVVWEDTPAIFLKMGLRTGGQARFGTSPDGINWTLRSPTMNTLYNDAVWHPTLNLWVAVGNQAIGTHNVAISPDAITWTGVTAIAGADLWCIEYASSLGLLVACSSTSYVFSENAVDWWEAAGTALSPTRGSDLIWDSTLERFSVAAGNGVGYFSLE